MPFCLSSIGHIPHFSLNGSSLPILYPRNYYLCMSVQCFMTLLTRCQITRPRVLKYFRSEVCLTTSVIVQPELPEYLNLMHVNYCYLFKLSSKYKMGIIQNLQKHNLGECRVQAAASTAVAPDRIDKLLPTECVSLVPLASEEPSARNQVSSLGRPNTKLLFSCVFISQLSPPKALRLPSSS